MDNKEIKLFIQLWNNESVTFEHLMKKFKCTSEALQRRAMRLREKGYSLIKRHKKLKLVNNEVEDKNLTEEEKEVLLLLKNKSMSLGTISDKIDRSKRTVELIIERLWKKNYDVKYEKDSKQVILDKGSPFETEFKPIDSKLLKKDFIRMGVVSDTHFGSKFQQMTLLHTAYELFDKENVDFIVHAGDIIDGKRVYRGQEHEVFLQGADEMEDYTVEKYPKLTNGRKTYILAGNHDASFITLAGRNIVRGICNRRDDLVYRGCFDGFFEIGNFKIEVMHPKGGVGYSRSYKPQRIAESLVGSCIELIMEGKKEYLPHIVLIGHYHVHMTIRYMGMQLSMLPCFQAQTPYLKALGLAPEIGCVIFDIGLDNNGALSYLLPKFYFWNSQVKERDF